MGPVDRQGHGATHPGDRLTGGDGREQGKVSPDDGAGRCREAPMSFRELTMIDVREVLRRWQAGQSERQIAREAGADRKTVGRYIAAAKSCPLDAQSELTDDVVAEVAQRVQARPVPALSDERKLLELHRTRIETWLGADRPLRLVRIHELLSREDVHVGYTTLRRFAHDELGWREPRVTVRVDDPPPGEEAQIDFGLMGHILVEGVRRRLWVLIVTLSSSRYQFVWPTFTQTVEDVCAGLDAAWTFFGGVVQRVVLDNASSMVVRADAQSPALQKSFAEYMQARGVFADPARVRHPRDKARVENQVPYVRERWFDGETFTGDLPAIRSHAATWCRDVAGTRVHGTTRCVPRDVYEAEEKPRMQPAPSSPFDVPRWAKAKIHPDHHAQVGRALYSLPTQYIGKTLEVRADRATVRFYLGATLVKAHARVAPGKRATDARDFPSDRSAYALRSVDGVREIAKTKGEHIGAFAMRLLEGPLPWIKMRQAYGLLRLCDRYGAERVDALCARALAFDVIDTRRIERMLKTAQSSELHAETQGKLIPLPGRFARDPATFATRTNRDEGGAS
jgi:transposase